MKEVKQLVALQQQMAADMKVAFFNFFEAMGGEGSVKTLVERSYANKDYTHLNYKGGKELASDLVIGRDADHFSGLYDDFLEMMHSKGAITPDEDRFEDAIAFAGVSKFPARVKCALLAWAALRDAVSQASAKEN